MSSAPAQGIYADLRLRTDELKKDVSTAKGQIDGLKREVESKRMKLSTQVDIRMNEIRQQLDTVLRTMQQQANAKPISVKVKTDGEGGEGAGEETAGFTERLLRAGVTIVVVQKAMEGLTAAVKNYEAATLAGKSGSEAFVSSLSGFVGSLPVLKQVAGLMEQLRDTAYELQAADLGLIISEEDKKAPARNAERRKQEQAAREAGERRAREAERRAGLTGLSGFDLERSTVMAERDSRLSDLARRFGEANKMPDLGEQQKAMESLQREQEAIEADAEKRLAEIDRRQKEARRKRAAEADEEIMASRGLDVQARRSKLKREMDEEVADAKRTLDAARAAGADPERIKGLEQDLASAEDAAKKRMLAFDLDAVREGRKKTLEQMQKDQEKFHKDEQEKAKKSAERRKEIDATEAEAHRAVLRSTGREHMAQLHEIEEANKKLLAEAAGDPEKEAAARKLGLARLAAFQANLKNQAGPAQITDLRESWMQNIAGAVSPAKLRGFQDRQLAGEAAGRAIDRLNQRDKEEREKASKKLSESADKLSSAGDRLSSLQVVGVIDDAEA